MNVDDTGETADEIFYEAEALSVDDKEQETKEELYRSHDQKTMNAETQTPESGEKLAKMLKLKQLNLNIYLRKLFCNLLLRNVLLIMMTE